MTIPITLDLARLRNEVQSKYTDVATDPHKGFHFHVGRPLARMLKYPEALVATLPDSVVESFAGVGNPFAMGPLPEEATVLDIGSGSGFDAVLAAQMVGPRGSVIGVDVTPAMLEKARANAALMGLTNLEFRQGLAEELPLDDASVEIVISNGVLNLVPDKARAYAEIVRVLKPGGRAQIADVVVQKPVSPRAKEDIDLWTG